MSSAQLNESVRVALVGCGYVADFYVGTMRAHPKLQIAGVTDTDPLRLAQFTEHHRLPSYKSLEEVLRDSSISIVVNLTNPRSHYTVSRKCLEAGKHVYSEKPISLRLSEAELLVDLAERKGLFRKKGNAGFRRDSACTSMSSCWRFITHPKTG